MVESVRVIEQKAKLASALTSIAVSLTKTTNGHAVIDQFFRHLLPPSKRVKKQYKKKKITCLVFQIIFLILSMLN